MRRWLYERTGWRPFAWWYSLDDAHRDFNHWSHEVFERLLEPRNWNSLWLRRALLILFPVTVPLWCLTFVAFLLVTGLLGATLGLVVEIANIWRKDRA